MRMSGKSWTRKSPPPPAPPAWAHAWDMNICRSRYLWSWPPKSARTIAAPSRFATQPQDDMVAPLPAPPTPMDQDLKATLSRIVEALDRLAPSASPSADTNAAEAYVWHAAGHRLEAVPKVNRVALDLLMGVDRQKETLLENTRRFANGLPANNALLWGLARRGQELVGEGRARPGQPRDGRPTRAAGADRDPSRGHPVV